MIIDAPRPQTLRIETPYHPEIVERLKSLLEREYDAKTKCWYVPVRLFDDVMGRFPKASLTYAAVAAACDAEAQRAHNFIDGLRYFGIALRLDGDDIVVEGASVSPVIEEAVMVRADAVRRVLASEHPCQNRARLEKQGAGVAERTAPVCLDAAMHSSPENGVGWFAATNPIDELFAVTVLGRSDPQRVKKGAGDRQRMPIQQGELFREPQNARERTEL